MIYLLYGENEFAKRCRRSELVAGAEAEYHDGEELDAAALSDLVRGQSLLCAKRVVVISRLSNNPTLWSQLPTMADALDGVTLILFETKPDKRTKTYKWLQKHATVIECISFGERQRSAVIQWCIARAKQAHGFTLESQLAECIVERLGHDQLRLDTILEQLALVDTIDRALIDAMLPLEKSENVFRLFDAVLLGDQLTVKKIIRYLETTSGNDGAYQTLGLLASRVTILTGLVLGGSAAGVAADAGASPFVVRDLAARASSVSTQQLRAIITSLAQADQQMKSTTVNPWLLLETALVGVMQKPA